MTSDSKQKACIHKLNHVGISVPNCEEAIAWYGSVFDFHLLKPMLHVKRDDFPTAPIFKVFGDELREFKLAWLGTGHSVGLELFEFIDPCHRAPEGLSFDYSRGGVFHFAVTVPNVGRLLADVIAAGGKVMSEIIPMPMGNSMAYCQDPWGNTIELLTATFGDMVSNGAPKEK